MAGVKFNPRCLLSALLLTVAFFFIENSLLYLVLLLGLGVVGVLFCRGYFDVESYIPGVVAVFFSQAVSYYFLGLTVVAVVVQYLLTLLSLWLFFVVVEEFL